MTVTSVALRRAERADELYQIHNAVCRARKQGLVCGTCTDLFEQKVAAIARWVMARDAATGVA